LLQTFYLDTSIWMDIRENRGGYEGEPLGDYGLKLLMNILAGGDSIAVSELLFVKLQSKYSNDEITSLFAPFEKILNRIHIDRHQREWAQELAMVRNVPRGDVLHAILARDNNLILVTRDRHFKLLDDIARHFKPEELV
ncbi:MAG: PIN domain-containing protein, partial [Candidatus Woesearchaeota archaeon]